MYVLSRDFYENDLCNICADETRDKDIVCSRRQDIISFEKLESLMELIMF